MACYLLHFKKGRTAMIGCRSQCVIAFTIGLLALTGAGCGGPGVPVPESLSRDAKLDGITVTLEIKNEKAPELNSAVTHPVVANFSGHRVAVDQTQVTLDAPTKNLPAKP